MATTTNKLIRCGRCGKRCRNTQGWNATLSGGLVVAVLCPDCQTPQENAEAAINEATLDYDLDAQGRFTGSTKRTAE